MGWSGLVHGIKHTQGEWRTKYAINTNKLYSPRSISQDSGQCVGVFFVLINSKGKITITHPQSCPQPFVTGRLLFGLVCWWSGRRILWSVAAEEQQGEESVLLLTKNKRNDCGDKVLA